MIRRTTLAASLLCLSAVAELSLAQSPPNADRGVEAQVKRATADANAAQRSSAADMHPAATTRVADPTLGVADGLAAVVSAATTADDLKGLADHFVDADRTRLAVLPTFKAGYGPVLDGRIGEVRKAWKSKYGHDLGSADGAAAVTAAFANAIAVGPVGSDADLAAAVLGTGKEADTSRVVAVATIPAADGLPAVKVPLMRNDAGTWVVNVPDELTAAAIQTNLTDQLNALGNADHDWPADEAAAYRLLSHRVLIALMNPTATPSPK